MMTNATEEQQVAVRLLMKGLVQGQGIRPTIARLAAEYQVNGTVCNSSAGVKILASAECSRIDSFTTELRIRFSSSAVIVEPTVPLDRPNRSSFCITDSESGHCLETMVPLDLKTCSDCLGEVRSETDRRRGYPFNSCAQCGPRYSILRGMPFDRAATSMDAFPMCSRCEAEYRDLGDRRFHAQTVSCPVCGPRCWVTDRSGNLVAGPEQAMESISDCISAGQVAAVKGVGGYQLICDATNQVAVGLLRKRKGRFSKPLPVMVAEITDARQFAIVDHAEERALQSPAGPIVLLRAGGHSRLCGLISPNLNSVGVMLPTSAMHAILVDRVGRPLVVTSGNAHQSPIIYKNEISGRQLATLADVFLHHDREITFPIDDSVVQCVSGKPMTIRAGRGIAPIALSYSSDTTGLSTGGHLKVAPAMVAHDSIVLSPHIGSMETEGCRVRFSESVTKLRSLYQARPEVVFHDRHPNYFTTDWAADHGGTQRSVQHHHAHVAAAMLEHNLIDETVLGIAFDGTGYGDDGTVWGGEALLARAAGFERIGHLRPFRLPGGESAIKRPMRILASLRSQIGGPVDDQLRYAIDHGPITSSMGRLFDAVAALVLEIDSVEDEGEAAMRLEAACDLSEATAYRFAIIEDSPVQFDWRPVLKAIESDLGSHSAGRIAMKFHRAVANLVCQIAVRYDGVPCVLSGGVFQNRTLLELIQRAASQRSADLRMPGKIPVNDGGIAIGQLVAGQVNCPGVARPSVTAADLRDGDGDLSCA